MKKKTYKIILCISLFIMLFVNFGNVFGATNPDYKPTVNVSENALDTKIKSSVLLDTLANMINAIASLAETLIGGVFQTLTKDNIFPWADRIIFNGIAFLDINFLNPDDSSLFGSSSNPTILGDVVRQVYSTVFSLAILFLGVAVGIMAIRLAISTIAAEKAKYKQAIVNWATCIVMLFLMHYILAFVFWVNEQMVQIASNILLHTIEDSDLSYVDFSEALNSIISSEDRVNNYLDTVSGGTLNGDAKSFFTNIKNWFVNISDNGKIEANKKVVQDNSEIASRFLTNASYVSERLVYAEDNATNWFSDMMKESWGGKEMAAQIGLPRLVNDINDAKQINTFLSPPTSGDKNDQKKYQSRVNSRKTYGYYEGATKDKKIWFDKSKYLASPDYISDLLLYAWIASHKDSASDLFSVYTTYPQFKINFGDNPAKYQVNINSFVEAVKDFSDWTGTYSSLEASAFASKVSEISQNASLQNKIADQRIRVDGYVIASAIGVTSSTTDIIANLGQFFKQSAYVYTTEEVDTGSGETAEVVTGWRASKVSVTGALLYAIFLFQSCMYFITYVKRLFFVIMLSMFGPLVVIYDFFMKSAAG